MGGQVSGERDATESTRIAGSRLADGSEAALSVADRRVGILGGTFDPIHYGHLVIAEEVAEALSLDRVLFVPAAVPPHKIGLAITPADDRATMVELAIAGNPGFAMSRVELERTGPSYTADTLAELAGDAGTGSARELFFILSTEALAGLPDWHEPERILALARLAVVPRPGSPMPPAAELRARFGDRADRVVAVETVPLAHSASAVRARAAAGQSIRYLVPPAVEAYICEHRLYRSGNLPEDCPK
jgi:nicotinate-nucleotide adenylyltransferase